MALSKTNQLCSLWHQDFSSALLRKTAAKEVATIFAASLFMALCSWISIPLLFTPVPVSLQTLGVLAIGASLGKSRGALAVALYLFQGMLGLPFFAGGCSGIASFLGPQGGYLLGFVAGAFITGLCFEKIRGPKNLSLLLSLLLGNAGIYLIGLPWLSLWVGPSLALKLGFYPFILGDLLKLGVFAAYLRRQ